jgi:hypothetical protein
LGQFGTCVPRRVCIAHLFVEALFVLLMDESELHAPCTNCHYRTNTHNDANLVERRVEDTLGNQRKKEKSNM